MLGRDNNRVDLLGFDRSIGLLEVLDGDLGLSVRSQPPEEAGLANIRQSLSEPCGDGVSQRHGILGLVASIAEHDALITSTDVQVLLSDMHTSSDVGALLVDSDQNLTGLVGETLGVNAGQIVNIAVEADLRDDSPHHLVVVNLGLSGDLTGDHDHVVLGGCLASDLALRVGGQASIQNSIGDLVADFVWVALVDRLGGEEEDALGPGLLLSRLGHGGCWKGGLVEKGNLEK
mmetsp:Transcript_69812/g.145936  ORF Transcript_69812/g.145936 Transcript_69812/m.145936 type:complete len:232 (-) Transcript_69812:35-730(-)